MPEYISPEKWADEPLIRGINAMGEPEGSAIGYRDVETLVENNEPLVEPNVMVRPAHDSIDEYTGEKTVNHLPGGVEGAILVVRESGARFLDLGQEILDEYYPGWKILALDGYRSGTRQKGGMKRTWDRVTKEKRIIEPTVAELMKYGKIADGTFSWANADIQHDNYKALKKTLLTDSHFIEELSEALTLEGKAVTPENIDKALFEYITISTNVEKGRGVGRKIRLDAEKNAHAGGGAIDMMITDEKGRPLSLVPYVFVGEEAAMFYSEEPGAYEHYLQSVKTNPVLAEHLKRLGYDNPEKFTRHEWDIFVKANRVRCHMSRALGGSFYTAKDPKKGGEGWHHEPGNILYNPKGKVIWAAPTAKLYPNSGNTSHTYEKLGISRTAVYGGTSAEKFIAKHYGFAA